MTNISANTTNDGPRLAGMRGAGETLKPDELANKVVTIVDSMVVQRKDGSTGHKWVIAHDDGTLGLYWAPGQTPPHQVQQWFRANPGRPLTVLMRREGGEQGYPRWSIEQRALDGLAAEQFVPDPAAARAPAAAANADEAPF